MDFWFLLFNFDLLLFCSPKSKSNQYSKIEKKTRTKDNLATESFGGLCSSYEMSEMTFENEKDYKIVFLFCNE